MNKAIRLGYYRIENGNRTRNMLASIFLELDVLEELKQQIEETNSHAIKYVLKEIFG